MELNLHEEAQAIENTIRASARRRGHDLLPEELGETLPPLYSQDGKGDDAVVAVKFFLPGTGWTWYAIEGEFRENGYLFFGWVEGDFSELGYWTLTDLEMILMPFGVVERDLYFEPKTLREVKAGR